MGDSLGDRMKENYENRYRFSLSRRMPVIIRVDGKAFHTYTRGLNRPFDAGLINSMITAATSVAEEMQGCKAVYVQSDEASFLLTDYDTLNTEAWFDYNKSKIETIAASTMTVWFNHKQDMERKAMFDARSFNVPREEVSNYFLWRARDWERNSLAMYCGAFFSHKQLHGKGKSDKHEMLHSIGKNWTTDLVPMLRNGTFLVRTDSGFECRHPEPSFANIDAMLDPLVNCDKVPEGSVAPPSPRLEDLQQRPIVAVIQRE